MSMYPFDGDFLYYWLGGVIGFAAFPLFISFAFGFACLLCKLQDYIHYVKKRKKVFDKLYPQYEELMKGDTEDGK